MPPGRESWRKGLLAPLPSFSTKDLISSSPPGFLTDNSYVNFVWKKDVDVEFNVHFIALRRYRCVAVASVSLLGQKSLEDTAIVPIQSPLTGLASLLSQILSKKRSMTPIFFWYENSLTN